MEPSSSSVGARPPTLPFRTVPEVGVWFDFQTSSDLVGSGAWSKVFAAVPRPAPSSSTTTGSTDIEHHQDNKKKKEEERSRIINSQKQQNDEPSSSSEPQREEHSMQKVPGKFSDDAAATSSRSMALKIIQRSTLDNHRCYNDVLRETRVLEKLAHPNCPRLLDTLQTEKEIAIGMSLAKGRTLTKILQERKAVFDEAVLPESTCAKIAQQLVSALVYLHRDRRVVHRDVKPDNVVVDFVFPSPATTTAVVEGSSESEAPEGVAAALRRAASTRSLDGASSEESENKSPTSVNPTLGASSSANGNFPSTTHHHDPTAESADLSSLLASPDAVQHFSPKVVLVDFGFARSIHPRSSAQQQQQTTTGEQQNNRSPTPSSLSDSDEFMDEQHQPHQAQEENSSARSSTTPVLLSHTICGSERFMPPELLSWVVENDFATQKQSTVEAMCAHDAFGLGVVCYIMLSGNYPFNGKTKAALVSQMRSNGGNGAKFTSSAWRNVSDEAKQFVSSLLRADVGERLSLQRALEHPWLAQ